MRIRWLRKMKSILLIGQSNMAGRGFIDSVSPIIDERIKVLKNGRWQMMAEPIHGDRSVAGIGPAASFAKMWVDAHPGETLGLIPCADGGTEIDEWSKDGVLTRHALMETRFALETSELIGILWHQGESDSSGGKYRTYASKLQQLIEVYRSELALPQLPFIIGELGDYLGKSGFGLSANEYSQINQCLRDVANDVEHCYYVTGSGLQANPDGIHIDAASQRLLGMRYFAAFNQRTHIPEPLLEEEHADTLLYKTEYTKNEQMYQLVESFSKSEINFETFAAEMAKLQS